MARRVSPVIVDVVPFIGSTDRNVYALNATTGALIWNYTTGGSAWSRPAVVDGIVFVGSGDDNLYALNATTGQLVWSYESTHWFNGGPAVAYGMVFASLDDGNIYALDEYNGTLIWSVTIGSYGYLLVHSSPAVADNLVLVGNEKIYALNAADGAVVWSYPNVRPGHKCSCYRQWHDFYRRILAFRSVHDIALTSVVPSKTVVWQGYSLSVNITLQNQGDFNETATTTIFVNNTSVTNMSFPLPIRKQTTITFTWNTTGTAKDNYPIGAHATPVSPETDTTDNTYVDGEVAVTMVGDVDNDV